jgi:hypothetical protein
MKKMLLFCFIFFTALLANAQDLVNDFFMKTAKPIKATTLVRTNSQYGFKTNKWTVVKDTELLTALFDITDSKDKLGATVTQVHFLGWWGLNDGQIAYLYAYEAENDNKTKATKVFISTYKGVGGKTIDVNPFDQNPQPTGMRGKVTRTDTFTINDFGAIKLTTTNKTASGKILKKENSFYINENGNMTVSGQ